MNQSCTTCLLVLSLLYFLHHGNSLSNENLSRRSAMGVTLGILSQYQISTSIMPVANAIEESQDPRSNLLQAISKSKADDIVDFFLFFRSIEDVMESLLFFPFSDIRATLLTLRLCLASMASLVCGSSKLIPSTVSTALGKLAMLYSAAFSCGLH